MKYYNFIVKFPFIFKFFYFLSLRDEIMLLVCFLRYCLLFCQFGWGCWKISKSNPFGLNVPGLDQLKKLLRVAAATEYSEDELGFQLSLAWGSCVVRNPCLIHPEFAQCPPSIAWSFQARNLIDNQHHPKSHLLQAAAASTRSWWTLSVLNSYL